MRNIYLLPTEKPSRLFKFANQLHLDAIPKDYYKKYNIYITSDVEIKEGYAYYPELNEVLLFDNKHGEIYEKGRQLKVILTTNQDLIADGVQAIDDEFLEWFVKNPSCESVDVEKRYSDFTVDPFVGYKIIIPKEEPKQEMAGKAFYESADKVIVVKRQETLEEAAANLADPNICKTDNWIAGAKWMQEQMEKLKDFDVWKEWKNKI